MRIIAVLLAFLLLWGGEVARAIWAVDGDTIYVVKKGRRYRVRLIGVNTPELDSYKPYLKKWAMEALYFTASMVVGRDVVLSYDRERYDDYGRLLAYVRVKEGWLNEMLLREGLAWVYLRKDYRLKSRYIRLEKQARRYRRGLFGDRPRRAYLPAAILKPGRYYYLHGKIERVEREGKDFRVELEGGVSLIFHRDSVSLSAFFRRRGGVHPAELFRLLRNFGASFAKFPFPLSPGKKVKIKSGLRLEGGRKEAHVFFASQCEVQ